MSKWKLLLNAAMAAILSVNAALAVAADNPKIDLAQQKIVMDDADALFNSGKHELALDKIEDYLLENSDSAAAWEKSCVWNLQASIEVSSKAATATSTALEISGTSSSDMPPIKVNTVADALLAKAEYSCQRFVELAPNNPEAHFYLSNVFIAKQWYVHAFWQIAKGLEFDADAAKKLAATTVAVKLNPAETELVKPINYAEIVTAAKNNRYYLLDKIGDSKVNIEVKLPSEYVDAQNNFLSTAVPASELTFVALSAAIDKAPKVAAGYYNRALYGLQNYSSTNVENDFFKVIELAPKWFAGYSGLAAYYIQSKNYKQARSLLEQANALNSNDATTNFNADLLKMFDESVLAYTIEELVKIKDAVAVNEDNLRSFDETLANMAGYIRRDPTSAELYEAYADVYAQSKGQYYRDNAAKYYQQALQLGGNTDRLNTKLAKVTIAGNTSGLH